jgi:hypothetical protein
MIKLYIIEFALLMAPFSEKKTGFSAELFRPASTEVG